MVAIKETSGSVEQIAIDLPESSAKEAVDLLDQARGILKKRLSFFVWQGFFEPLSAISLSAEKFILQAPTSFHRNWVIDHYMSELIAAVSESLGYAIEILIEFCPDGKKKLEPVKKKEREAVKEVKPARLEKTPERATAPILSIQHSSAEPVQSGNLNPTYSFEAYIQGPSNQMGYSAALSVADHPGLQFSPLFLFGGVGLGKTHLLHAIGLRAKEKNPTLKVLYLSAEQWVNLYIQAIRERQFDAFRNRFRSGCDILLIDDIQFLAGKDASQDEFFHTFNCLHEAKRQMVVTSDKYPHEIDGLEERLRTRLSWGLIADIRPPEMETRTAILHKKAESLSVKLSDEVLNFLALSVKSSVRELEGALVRLAACSSFSKEPMTINQARDILAPIIKKKTAVTSWQKVCEMVASYYDLRTADLLGKDRKRQVVFARQVAMSICRSMLNMSLPEIGLNFGGRDHTTVLSSIRKIDALKQQDISLQSSLQKLETKIASLSNA